MADAPSACRNYLNDLQAHTKAIKKALDTGGCEIDDEALMQCLSRAVTALEEAGVMLGIPRRRVIIPRRRVTRTRP